VASEVEGVEKDIPAVIIFIDEAILRCHAAGSRKGEEKMRGLGWAKIR
jgi:hypothetical protein